MADKQSSPYIILASASPRRKEILEGMGARFSVMCADADESCDKVDPVDLTKELARRKGNAVLSALSERKDQGRAIVISADTVVACEGQILGKPRNEHEAREMLSLLSGRTHIVVTGVSVAYNGKVNTDASVTRVTVDDIPPEQIEKYIQSGEPFDKAGGYGIQGTFSKWVRGIDGCYFGVVGLPVNLLGRLFKDTVGVYPDEL